MKVALVCKADGRYACLADDIVVEGHTLLWTVESGRAALERSSQARPEVVLWCVDVDKGRSLMQELAPRAPLVITYELDGDLGAVDDALQRGAVTTFKVVESAEARRAELRHRLITVRRLALSKMSSRPAPPHGHIPLVAIGASTGGPRALSELLAALPASFPAAVLIVQHIEAEFVPGLVDSLSNHTRLRVQAASEGERPTAGVVMLAAKPDRHLTIDSSLHLHYAVEPRNVGHRPSVDVLFESLARFWPVPGTGILLTGMGADGAVGLEALQKKGWRTIAQSEASCAVYGMPRAAVALGAASDVLAIDAIGPLLGALVRAPRRAR